LAVFYTTLSKNEKGISWVIWESTSATKSWIPKLLLKSSNF